MKLKKSNDPRHQKSPWYIDYTIAGVRRRKFFPTKQLGHSFIDRLSQARYEKGVGALVFSQSDKDELAACRLELLDYGISVLDAVKAFKEMKPLGKSLSLDEAIKKFIATREALRRRQTTIENFTLRLSQFRRFVGDIDVCRITREHLEEWAQQKQYAPRTIRNNFTTILTFLRWLKSRGMITINLDFDRNAVLPREEKTAKRVFTRAQVESLFAVLESNPRWRCYIPFFALQAFAGLRNSEASRLSWKNINIAAGTLNLPASIVKTGEEFTLRRKDLPENLWLWLAAYRDEPISRPSVETYLRIAKAIGGWQRNGLRHTFCTMHISKHGDTVKTSLILRHRNQQRLWQNYLANLVEEDDARCYFEIIPQKNGNEK